MQSHGWVCEKCGEPNSGEMCVKCGGATPLDGPDVVRAGWFAAYLGPSSSGRPPKTARVGARFVMLLFLSFLLWRLGVVVFQAFSPVR